MGFNWISSPAATELEAIVMDWMDKLLKLPHAFLFSGEGGGVMHGMYAMALFFVCFPKKIIIFKILCLLTNQLFIDVVDTYKLLETFFLLAYG